MRHCGLNQVSHGICKKGKVVPLQARSGPEGSKKLRFPDFVKTAQDGGKFVSLTYLPPLPPGNTPGTHFCQRLSQHGTCSYIYIIIMYTESSTLCLIKFLALCDSLCEVRLDQNKELADRNRTLCGDSSRNLRLWGGQERTNCPQPAAELKKTSRPPLVQNHDCSVVQSVAQTLTYL